MILTIIYTAENDNLEIDCDNSYFGKQVKQFYRKELDGLFKTDTIIYMIFDEEANLMVARMEGFNRTWRLSIGDINLELVARQLGYMVMDKEMEDERIENAAKGIVTGIDKNTYLFDKMESRIEKEREKLQGVISQMESKNELYSLPLRNYLNKLKKMINTVKIMGNYSVLWSQALLISIDDGFGLTTFLKRMSYEFIKADIVSLAPHQKMYSEFYLDAPSDSGYRYKDWDILCSAVKDCAQRRPDRLLGILCCDICKWISELDTKEIKEYLREIVKIKAPILIVFRIPYMENRVVADIERKLSDIIGTKSIIVPPVSLVQMVDYMYCHAKEMNYSISDDCSDILESAIIAEKNDGFFYGYKSLDKLFDTISYAKLEYNMKHGLSDKNIDRKQLSKFLRITDEPDVDDMFSHLVGVTGIREQIEAVIKQIQVYRMLSSEGKKVKKPGIHMLFTGNPGTGKTTIARIVARMMKDAGILSKGHLLEIKGRDLCGQHIGETTPKTVAYCRDAYGSVLFIDEAYELNQGKDDVRDYGHEAVTALIAEMENHRDDMCVIMAGYKSDMEKLLKINDGLADRLQIKIEFPNYTRDELEHIFYNMLEEQFAYEEELRTVAHEYFKNLPDELLESREFSNARFVRNLFERVWGEAALRYSLDNTDDIFIKVNDFISALDKAGYKDCNKIKKNPLGFI